MLKKIAIAGLMVFSMKSMALAPATSKAQFCQNQKSSNYVKELALDGQNRMAFRNNGGLINGGVCWWHSRFLRNALYLAYYSPNKNKPSDREAKRIIKAIRKGRKLIEIPGFSNLREFTSHFRAEVQNELEKWQKWDGFVAQQWVVGLAGSSSVSADSLKANMDELYQHVMSEGYIGYAKLQLPGVPSHAYLVVDMEKVGTDGYRLRVIDSNYGSIQTWNYRYGMESFRYNYWGEFVPYLGKEAEVKRLREIQLKKCK